MRAETESDDALVARAGRGDRLAAGELVLRHTDKLFAACWRMTGNREAAEDAVQETFLRLWKSAARWRPGNARIDTWLYRVAMNICIDRYRMLKREAPEEAAPEIADGALGADAQIAQRERDGAVNEALMDLPERQRQALTLCHYQELSNIETADVMGISVEAVESLLARGRRALKQALAPRRAEFFEDAGNV